MISIALLRGVNVGGHRKVPMADLRSWLLAAGLGDVRTYIQSGNVVLEHAPRIDVAALVHDVIEDRGGFDVPVIVRSAAQWSKVIAANPYRDAAPTELHVSFLAGAPDDASVAAATKEDWAPEEFAVVGRDVYLHLPQGMGRSVMVPRLKVIAGATTRNWNTVLALRDLARS